MTQSAAEVRTRVVQEPNGRLRVFLYSKNYDAIAGPAGKKLALEVAQQAGYPQMSFTDTPSVYPVDEAGNEITDFSNFTKQAAQMCCEYVLVKHL